MAKQKLNIPPDATLEEIVKEIERIKGKPVVVMTNPTEEDKKRIAKENKILFVPWSPLNLKQ